MIDHLTVSVADLPASKRFYTAVLAPLGYAPMMDFEQFSSFGDVKPYFWLKQAPTVTTPQHLAFAARSRAMVVAFFEAALAAGAKEDGRPGLRTDYHPNYYAAFVIDPLNGHPIEAVCHAAPGAKKALKKAPKAKARAKKPAKKAARGRR